MSVQVQGRVAPLDKQNLLQLIALGRFSSESDAVREAVRLLLKAHQMILKKGVQETLTSEDKVVLETIAEDHWQQYHSFEEDEVSDSIKTEFKLDKMKPKNQPWLKTAIEYVCRQKRN